MKWKKSPTLFRVYSNGSMQDLEYFSNLYEIASHLNKEFSLQAALRNALERTVDLLGLESGWIWLVQSDNKSVYLAASYNLPPALGNHPERLSGWCYCIQKYFSGAIPEARNISEITCSRLKNIRSETDNLKYHASVPISIQGEKAGLLNLVRKENQQLDDKQLSILNTISELMGIAIQRTRHQDSFRGKGQGRLDDYKEILGRVLQPRMAELVGKLESIEEKRETESKEQGREKNKLSDALKLAKELHEQVSLMIEGIEEESPEAQPAEELHYPTSPLTKRELEVLALVRKGNTNKQISESLYISERTVKFHITSILSKLYAETRTQAVDIALRRGLLSL